MDNAPIGPGFEVKQKSQKSYAVAVALSAVFGVLGIQHFYLGRYLLGLFGVGLSILALYCFVSGQILYAFLFFAVDFGHSLITTIMLLTGSFKDGNGHYVFYPGQELK